MYFYINAFCDIERFNQFFCVTFIFEEFLNHMERYKEESNYGPTK